MGQILRAAVPTKGEPEVVMGDVAGPDLTNAK
jgi:hypothetical protein